MTYATLYELITEYGIENDCQPLTYEACKWGPNDKRAEEAAQFVDRYLLLELTNGSLRKFQDILASHPELAPVGRFLEDTGIDGCRFGDFYFV